MKRLKIILLIFVAAFALCSCIPIERYSKATPTPEPTAQPTQTPDASPLPTEDPTPTPLVRFFNEPSETPEQVRLVIDKSDKMVNLYADDVHIGAFPCALGSAQGAKTASGDKKTPEGQYYICSKGKSSSYDKFLGISYPNKTDAQSAYDDDRISKSEYNTITQAIEDGKRPPDDTALGGEIGIYADSKQTTSGGIAVSGEDILILWEYVNLGDEVEIIP